jgi:phage head maturation protease
VRFPERGTLARGDISGSSFGFAIAAAADEEWSAPPARGELPLRTLKKLRLIDVSPVTFPAYQATSVVAMRDESHARREERRRRIDAAKREARKWLSRV